MKRQKETTTTERSSVNDVRTERRSSPRIYDPFPATVRGKDADGESFESETVIDNLSADGLYLRLMQHVKQGARLSVVFQLSLKGGSGSRPRVSVKGLVLRTESKPGGVWGAAITFDRSRFLFS
jgi:hypothetical protein